jgi:hypothetical protein
LKTARTASQLKESLSKAGTLLNHADAELLDLLEQWDKNGDGQYSVDEVLLIARHFQQKERQVAKLKRTLCLGSLFAIVLLLGMLFVSLQANEISKDMRPSRHGVLTTTDGKVAGVAQVMRRADLDAILNMTDDQLTDLQFVSFNLSSVQYVLKVAGAARRHAEMQEEAIVDLFFVNGPFAEMQLLGRHNGTVEMMVSTTRGEERRLQPRSLSPWMHISQAQQGTAGIVGLSGTDVQQLASAPWQHIGR